MKTILVPIDFSPTTNPVVLAAAKFARAFEGRIVLLSVVQPPVVMSEVAPSMESIAEFTAVEKNDTGLRLARLAEKLKAEFVPAEGVVTIGSPVQHIVEHAKKIGADYIVMGSHGHSGAYDLIVGSTTQGVLLRAKCPVIVVPAAERIAARRPREQYQYRAVA